MHKEDQRLFGSLYTLEQLAEQDLLSASASGDPVYWHQQALERMETYRELRITLHRYGSTFVVEHAQDQLAKLNKLSNTKGQYHGQRQALELFLILAADAITHHTSAGFLEHAGTERFVPVM